MQITCRPPSSAIAFAQLDVGAAAGHVGGDGDAARLARLGHDVGLGRQVMGVEDGVLDSLRGQQLGEVLRLVDGARADQHRPPLGVKLADFRRPRPPISLRGAEDLRPQLLPDGRAVGGDGQDVAAIDLAQFAGRIHGRARHAGQVLVAEEEVLDGHAGRLPGGHGDLDPFLGLDRLVHALAPLAAFGQPAGELVDDHHLAVADDELPVARVLAIDHDRLLDVVVDVDHADGVHGLRLGQQRGPSAGPRGSARRSSSRGRTRNRRPRRTASATEALHLWHSTASRCSSVGSALMISGVRASSIRMLSASSTRAK